jgi:hypothetical protein
MMTSWKTSLFGVMAIVGGGIVMAFELKPALLAGFPSWLPGLGFILSTIGGGGVGIYARDNNRSSEQVGAGGQGNSQGASSLAKTLSVGLVLGLLGGMGFMMGCASVKAGADPLVVRVEQTEKAADATFTMVLGIDQVDRGFWRTNAPAFHQFCEWLRSPVVYGDGPIPRGVVIQLNVDDLKLAYQNSKTSGNSNALWSAWSTLSAALSQTTSWSNIITAPIHP